MPTKDELEAENAQLREELAAARAGQKGAPRKPARPTDDNGNPVLSAGEHADLEQHGVTISPFTGETLNAYDEGVEPLNPEAAERARQARDKLGPFSAGAHVGTETSAPVAGAPAEGRE